MPSTTGKLAGGRRLPSSRCQGAASCPAASVHACSLCLVTGTRPEVRVARRCRYPMSVEAPAPWRHRSPAASKYVDPCALVPPRLRGPGGSVPVLAAGHGVPLRRRSCWALPCASGGERYCWLHCALSQTGHRDPCAPPERLGFPADPSAPSIGRRPEGRGATRQAPEWAASKAPTDASRHSVSLGRPASASRPRCRAAAGTRCWSYDTDTARVNGWLVGCPVYKMPPLPAASTRRRLLSSESTASRPIAAPGPPGCCTQQLSCPETPSPACAARGARPSTSPAQSCRPRRRGRPAPALP